MSEAPFAVKIPITCAGIPGIADGVHDLVVRDLRGKVEMEQVDDLPDPSNFLNWRHWHARRAVHVPLTVTYRYHLAKAAPRAGPPFDLRANGGGVSGAGVGFLVLPEDEQVYSVRLVWDLKFLKLGSQAESSFGKGDLTLTVRMELLHFSFYMVGPLQTFEGSSEGFSAAWLGNPPFDVHATMTWLGKAFAALQAFFHDTNPRPFRVFMRTGPDNVTRGGAQLNNSFMLFLPTDARLTKDLNGVIAHEMVHHWIGSLDGTPGLTSWYGEGLAEYYSLIQMFRAGLVDTPEFLDLINRKAVRYYTNPLMNIQNQDVPAAFWRSRNGQIVPYDRGFFYFVDVNQKLRVTTERKVSLDHLVLKMIENRKNGQPYTAEAWLKLAGESLGPAAASDYERYIVKGNTIVVPSAAFGPCFERKEVTLRQFDLGFDERASLYSVPRVIKGVIPGSAAATAGLRDGDVLADPLDVEALRTHPEQKAVLKVYRGGQELEISYLPRAKEVPGYEWVRKSGVPEEQCREW
jgi:hypothetical protein